jgi:peptide/nickel transport system permease protein
VAALVLLLLVLSATFLLLEAAPGDPARLVVSPRVPPAQRDALHRALGLDRPLGERYLRWLGAAARGDWGVSFAQGRPVAALVGEALPPTLLLAAAAIFVQVVLGTWLGIQAARRRGTRVDDAIRFAALLLYALPAFWLGLLAVLLFHNAVHLFPASHLRSATPPGGVAGVLDVLHHLTLPALVLGLVSAGELARFLRGTLIEVLGQEHVRAARARGLSEVRIVWLHALRNALPPVVQVLGITLPALLSGALVVEVVFSWPGLGRLAYNAILTRDYPVVLATTALAGALVVAGTLVADLLHHLLDPRLRDG